MSEYFSALQKYPNDHFYFPFTDFMLPPRWTMATPTWLSGKLVDATPISMLRRLETS